MNFKKENNIEMSDIENLKKLFKKLIIKYKKKLGITESLVSSAVERQPFKLVVEGSIPSWGAFFF